MFILVIASVVVAFVAGVLVGRNNKTKVEAIVEKAEEVADKAQSIVNK